MDAPQWMLLLLWLSAWMLGAYVGRPDRKSMWVAGAKILAGLMFFATSAQLGHSARYWKRAATSGVYNALTADEWTRLGWSEFSFTEVLSPYPHDGVIYSHHVAHSECLVLWVRVECPISGDDLREFGDYYWCEVVPLDSNLCFGGLGKSVQATIDHNWGRLQVLKKFVSNGGG